MTLTKLGVFLVSAAICLFSTLQVRPLRAEPAYGIKAPETGNLWAHGNLHAFEVTTFDLVQRSPDERAQLLNGLGIRHYAYLASADPYGLKPSINTSQLDIDAEIEAMQRHGIDVRAWYFWVNTDNPADDSNVRTTLEAFKHHNIHPQIWVPQSFSQSSMNFYNPQSKEAFPKTPEEQRQRVQREADRIAAFVKLAAPYGCKVNLYNHEGWFGMVENQLAILDRLNRMGVADVGMVYNFAHSRSDIHDDSKTFPQLWARMKSHVVAVNVFIIDAREVEMMRTIENSGWQGAIGIEPWFWNAEIGFRNALWSLDWAAAQLKPTQR